LLKSLLDSQWLGAPQRFVARNGDMYNWGATTLGNMRKEMAGGGVLIDFGSHVIDLLFALFGGPAEVLEYRDNSLGGVEADCSLRLRFGSAGEPLEGLVELARTRKLGSAIRVECERGALEFELNERHRVRVIPSEGALTDPMTGRGRAFQVDAGWADEAKDESWYETFRTQIDDWVEAIRDGRPPLLSGRSALQTTRLIEDCYRQARPLAEPWVTEGLRSPACVVTSAVNGQRRRVLITGATGFIGARLAEVLTLQKGWQVRALVHNPANASRLARLPVEMVQSDELSSPEARRLVDGCDTVIHCAIGTTWGERNKIFAVNVDGTKNLADAARAQGVQRFVHLSTIALHGSDVTGILDETTPVRPARGEDYSESKVEAERVLLKQVRAGLPAVILRPACVYGPFSRIFIVRPIEAMAQGRFRLLAGADCPCNMVFVDNVIDAIIRSVEAPAKAVAGEVFTITDEDQLSWREFYEYFARALGCEIPSMPVADVAKASGRRGGSVLSPLAWARGVGTVLRSPELRAVAKRVLQTDPLGTMPRWALGRFPALERRLRRWFNVEALPIYRRPGPAAPDDVVEMGATTFLVSSAKAKRVMGHKGVVSRQRAMELTLDWVRHAKLIG
jgi:nucleoside-diphosphate-sugar epimerase